MRGEIDRLVAGLNAARLDAGEIQQCVNQFQKTQRVAVGRFEPLPAVRRQRAGMFVQLVFERSQHQSQGRPKLVANVREKRGLGPINLGEGFGAPAFFLIGAGVGHGGCYRGGDQVVKSAVGFIERKPGTYTDNQNCHRACATRRRNRQRQRRRWGFRIRATRERAEACF